MSENQSIDPNGDGNNGDTQNSKLTDKPPRHPSSAIGSNETNIVGSGKRSRTSPWWDHYNKIPDSDHARCNYCSAIIGCASKNGTGPLKNHIERCKKLLANMDKKQKMLEIGSKTFVRDDGVIETVCVPSLLQFDQKTARKALVRMIIVDEFPFAFVEHEGFRYFCKILNPAFVLPSRSTVTRDCYSFYVYERKKLKDCFKNLSFRVSLTTDAWTSAQNLSYMCLTTHFIDDNWVLRKRIINFCPLAGHSGELIGRGVEKCLVDWGIKNVMSLTVDNVSSNDLVVEYLRKRINHWESSILEGKYLHVRCVAHVLNLVVKDGLKDMDKSIMKVRALVTYVRSSPARLQRFKTCVKEEKIESKSLVCLDVETRWNSTYLMLESAIKFKKAFDNLLIRDNACHIELMKFGDISMDDDWKRLNYFIPILKVFYDATLVLSGSRYVTSNECAQNVFAIGFAISTLCNDEDEGCRKMAQRMKAKYDKYWGDIHNINYLLFVTILFDPRRKMHLADWLVRISFDSTKATILNLNLKMLVDELFKLYASSMPQESKQTSSSSSSSLNASMSLSESSQGKVMDFVKLLTSKFQMEMGCDDTIGSKTELERYLDEPRERDVNSFDILRWWELNQVRYPILSKMARDLLAIPVTTVASESAFSTGGRVLDSFRTSLTPRIVEALVCCQDWSRTRNDPVVIEENLVALEQLEEGMKDLIAEQPSFIIDESFDY